MKKSSYMILGCFSNASLTGIIKISDKVLERVRTAKFLGIQLDVILIWALFDHKPLVTIVM